MKTIVKKTVRKTRKIAKKHNVRNSIGRFTKQLKRDRLGRFT